MKNTRIMCAVMLDTKVILLECVSQSACCFHASEMPLPRLSASVPFECWPATSNRQKTSMRCWQGPEIRTGFLKNPDQPVKLTAGKEITITTDYEYKGDEETISMRHVLAS